MTPLDRSSLDGRSSLDRPDALTRTTLEGRLSGLGGSGGIEADHDSPPRWNSQLGETVFQDRRGSQWIGLREGDTRRTGLEIVVGTGERSDDRRSGAGSAIRPDESGPLPPRFVWNRSRRCPDPTDGPFSDRGNGSRVRASSTRIVVLGRKKLQYWFFLPLRIWFNSSNNKGFYSYLERNPPTPSPLFRRSTRNRGVWGTRPSLRVQRVEMGHRLEVPVAVLGGVVGAVSHLACHPSPITGHVATVPPAPGDLSTRQRSLRSR